jgi:hypothetical protein
MPGSPKWFLSLRFPHQNPVYATPLPHTRYMPPPSLGFLNSVNISVETRRIRYSMSHIAMLLRSAVQSVTCCNTARSAMLREASPDAITVQTVRVTCHSAPRAALCQQLTAKMTLFMTRKGLAVGTGFRVQW